MKQTNLYTQNQIVDYQRITNIEKIQQYYYLYGNSDDEVIAKKNSDGSINYYHNDLSSTTVLTDQAGNIIEKSAYEPYGEVKQGGTKSKYGYTGQEKDSETGLNYYEARYYDSHIHHFTQPDDIIQDWYNPQTLNRYAYAMNNPLKYTDPSGHIAFIPLVLIGATIFGFAGAAEAKLTYPYADWTAMAYGFATGAVEGAVTTSAAVIAAPVATAGLTSIGVSGAARAIGADVIMGGGLGGFQAIAKNYDDGKRGFDLLQNVPQSYAYGALTTGVGSVIGRGIISSTKGRPSSKLTIGFNGPKSVEHAFQNGVSQFVEKLTLPAIAAVYTNVSRSQKSVSQPAKSNTKSKQQPSSILNKQIPLWNLFR